MNVLVTGGAGFIGSHTANLLKKNKNTVFVLDNLTTGHRSSLDEEIHFVQGDILDTDLVQKILRENEIKAIVHFAAKLNVKESVLKPIEYYHNNVNGLISILKACQKKSSQNQVKYFIFSSSSHVYGIHQDKFFLNETEDKKPINPYGLSKLIGEQILQDAADQLDLRFVILRYFNAAGASQNLQNGQRTTKAYHLIHCAAQAALRPNTYVEIFGSDYQTQDGSCVRDYIHIEDLADVHQLALHHLENGMPSDIFNCGYGQGYSVKEILTCAQKMGPHAFEIRSSERRPGDPDYLVANVDKIKSTLNWFPKRNNIATICRTAIDWDLKLSTDRMILKP